MIRRARVARLVAPALAAVAWGLLGAPGCGRGPSAPVAARDGVAIALYYHPGVRYAVIDDRRWVDVAGDSVVFDHIDPGGGLSSLVIEPLAGALEIGACLRERIAPDAASGLAVPALRCAVRGRPGRYLVRLLYMSWALAYRVEHDIAMTAPDRATVVSRFAIVAPAWRTRAEVAVFDGVAGGESPPRELARGTIALDGGTALLATPPREVTARLRRIYDGAVRKPDGPDTRDPRWARDSHSAVWVWLELGVPGLAPGPVHVHADLPGEAIRDIDVPAAGRRGGAAELRLPLWIDDRLRGKRDRWTDAPDDAVLSDRFLVSVANTGDAPREVWIEEQLRAGARRTVGRAWPRSPEVDRRRLRMKLTVAPGGIERAGFAVDYER